MTAVYSTACKYNHLIKVYAIGLSINNIVPNTRNFVQTCTASQILKLFWHLNKQTDKQSTYQKEFSKSLGVCIIQLN